MSLIKNQKSKSKKSKLDIVAQLKVEMHDAAKKLDFERASELKNILIELKAL